MKHFCTLSDSKYTNQGLALYQSLIDNMNEPFILYYLCIDKEIFNKLTSLKLPHLMPYYVEYYDSLKNISDTSRQGYAWELASRFCHFLFKELKIDHIMYVDSDIIFYPQIETVYEEIGTKSIGIILHMHLQPAPLTYAPGYPGGFNVGIIYFKNDKNGRDCLNLWVKSVLDPGHDENINGKTGIAFNIKIHNTCGDQRFLEMFPLAFPDETIILGNKFAHGAPWNLHIYDFEGFSIDNKTVQINLENRTWLKHYLYDTVGKDLPLVFCHFAGFTPDYEKGIYAATRERFNEDFLKKQPCRDIYDEYYEKMKQAKELFDL